QYHTIFHQTYSIIYRTFFSHATATTEIYTLSLHDALPIFDVVRMAVRYGTYRKGVFLNTGSGFTRDVSASYAVPDEPFVWNGVRSEEHTSELQSRGHLVCRLLLEKKKKKHN